MTLMDRIKQEQNRGYVIAGGAAIIAFIAFILPYISISGSLIGNVPVSASGSTIGNWLWIEFLGVLVVIAVSAVFLFRSKLLTGAVNMPIDQQIKYGKYLLLGASILALLIHLMFLLSYSAVGLNYIGINPAYSVVTNVSLGSGYWLFMLSAIAMVTGSASALRAPVAAIAPAYGQQYPPQSMPYPPYQQPYSTADQQQQPYQQPYPTANQQPQQPYQQPYPTADQQSQQPYPPYQNPQQPQQYPSTEMQQPPQQW